MDYVVDLEVFHGPLDLLLYLIEKNEIDIYDIPVAQISDQYMEYLQKEDKINIENLGAFLLMASYLLQLKSKMLLPGSSPWTEEEQEEDPRADLVKSLLEYRRYKKVALWLEARQEGEIDRVFFRDFYQEVPLQEELTVDVKTLVKAYKSVVNRIPEKREVYAMPTGDINVAEKMEEILAKLAEGKEVVFQELFYGIKWRREALALFLALLELIRLGKVRAYQEAQEMPIKIFLQVEESS
ncbi:condensin subunit ScpA [Thermosyntropha lipolytica DSM 11003]|uniref:Segregation and condensation protein A n=1 Tax=Thermosyntropha lipolytica DSM 11003 TaxID=1123382 RepID=A0A1M5PA28_9FIRM|nr:segregation/condensation protein A [Thermosyntropha lipolytica]SHG98103.1 condensin subunit ScpA [Thermosyntropha lipolytica DSM 11003]